MWGVGGRTEEWAAEAACGRVPKTEYSVQCPVWAAEGSKSPAAKKMTFKSCWLVRTEA